jgi:multidrug efflux pump subunit AcrA (membrane-fusion protein)
MITEIEVKNPDLAIVPGMYATVVLKIDQKAHVIVIPSEAITSAQASTVDVVNTDDKIEERHIILGLETPNFCEVISGLKEGEKVMVGSQSRTHAGEKVEPKQWQAPVAKWSVPKGE